LLNSAPVFPDGPSHPCKDAWAARFSNDRLFSSDAQFSQHSRRSINVFIAFLLVCVAPFSWAAQHGIADQIFVNPLILLLNLSTHLPLIRLLT
jgi:hypothetical protein